MAWRFEIEVFDVTVDGFPDPNKGGAVAFIWDGEVFSGWPLIDRDGSYLGSTSFATPEQAKAGPLNVQWEASEDRVSGTFVGVRHWFRIPKV